MQEGFLLDRQELEEMRGFYNSYHKKKSTITGSIANIICYTPMCISDNSELVIRETHPSRFICWACGERHLSGILE